MDALLSNCRLCPRECGVNRLLGELGACRSGPEITAARASLHLWEEPCLSGKNGSGTVFFSGCNLGCVYCQNAQISRGNTGKNISSGRLCEIFFELKEQGAHNINLVTATHFLPAVLNAVEKAKQNHLGIPFVYNCGGFEKADMLKRAEGLIDIFLPDFKIMSPQLAMAYSNAPNYPEAAKSALTEMVRQQPVCVFDETGMLKRGVIVRHLMLPGNLKDSKKVLRYLHQTFGDKIFISIMSQYTPPAKGVNGFPELNRKVTKTEYEKLIEYAISLGITQAFVQEGETADASFIPDFDGRGI